MTPRPIDRDISRRISITRYLMVIGIILLHLPPYRPLQQEDDFLKAFLTFGVFRTTVPVLTAISAYLIFTRFDFSQTLALWASKVRRILLPLLIWNAPFVLAVYLVQRYGVVAHDFSVHLHPFQPGAWADALLGIVERPVNYPLNFLRDLFVLALLSPLYLLLLRKAPWAGAALVLLVYAFDLDGLLIQRNSMLVSFYVGGAAAVHRWNLRALDAHALPLGALLIGWSLFNVVLKIDNRDALVLVSPFLVWPAMSRVERTALGNWLARHAGASFLTFLSHGPVILALWLLFNQLMPHAPYALYAFAAPILAVLLALGAHRLMQRHAPRLAGLALGER